MHPVPYTMLWAWALMEQRYLAREKIVKSRRIFCQIEVKKMGCSGTGVARFLGINPNASAVN